MATRLTAMVPTAVIVDGVRTVIQPGDWLPEDTSAHDARNLVASGAAADPVASEKAGRAADRDLRAAQREFQEARALVAQEIASTAPAEDGAGTAKGKTAAK